MKTKNCFDQSVPVERSRWMIVDDNKDILWLLRQLAAQISGADIECFLSPDEALAAFTAAPGSFELVITDLEMSGMSGLTLGQRIRALSPATKILLTTGNEILAANEALGKGFCGLLRKPFSTKKLRDTLEAAGVETISTNFQTDSTVLTLA